MSTIKNRILISTVAAGLLVQDIPAFAQLEEIIVTARKREESILNVPVALTAFTGDQLETFATDDLYTLTERVPGFVMGTQVASIGPTPSLRGIGTGTLNASIDQSVSLNIDGLGFSQALAFTSAMFDMQSLAVLRGPQSLFYGKNSTAGVISVTTRDPGSEFEFSVAGGYEAEAEEYVGELIVSGPVTDTLGLRLAGKFSDMEGYFDNVGVGDGITSFDPKYPKTPDGTDLILRGTAVWAPIERFEAKLKLNYEERDIDGNGGAGQFSACPDGTISPPVTSPPVPAPIAGAMAALYGTSNPQWFAPNEDCDLDNKLAVVDVNPDNPLYSGIRNKGVPFFDLEQVFGTLQLNYEITPSLNLTSVTGYYDADHSVMINGGQTGGAGPLIIADTDFKREDFTQELRLTSNNTSAWNYMLGAYYQDAEANNRTGLFFLGPQDKGRLPIDIETWAVFGQVLWRMIPDVELAVGGRYTDEQRDFKPVNLTTGEPFPIELYVTDELSSDNFSPEVSVTYTPTQALTLFLGYRKAFKSGSWDTVSNPRGFDLSFDDEEVEGFEGGVKTVVLDNTLALNASAYYYEYDDLQVGANESTPTGFLIRTLNAASAEIYGMDFDLTWAPRGVEGLEVFGVVNYNHAEYDKFPNANCWGGQTGLNGCDQLFDPVTGTYNAQDLSGGDLLRAPEWTAAFGFTYEMPVARGGMILGFGSSTQYSDEYAANTLLRDDFYQDSYYKTSASLSLRDAENAWQIELIGKNLNDEVTAGNCTNFNGAMANTPGTIITGSPTGALGIAGVDEATCIAERGRELWIRLTLRPSAWM